MDARPKGPWMEAGREAGMVHSAQRGDLNAMLGLMRYYQRSLWRLCFAYTCDIVEAERLAQDAGRRALRNLRQLPAGQPFFPWLARLARTLAISRSRRTTGDGRDRREGHLRRPNGERWSSGAKGAHHIEYKRKVLDAYAELSAEDRTLLALRLFERLPYADIAIVSGVALAPTMHRIAALRERIEQSSRDEKAA